MNKKPLVFTLTGQSASGKTSLEKALQDTGLFGKAISHTTRPQRAGEADGVDYYFVTDSEFEGMVNFGRMIEHVEFGGYKYGISVEEATRLTEMGLPVIIVCEPNGRNQIAKFCSERNWTYVPVYVFAHHETILQRFVDRFIADVQNAGDSAADARKLRQSYFSRLMQMTMVENKWTREEFGYTRSFLMEDMDCQRRAINWFNSVAVMYGYGDPTRLDPTLQNSSELSQAS